MGTQRSSAIRGLNIANIIISALVIIGIIVAIVSTSMFGGYIAENGIESLSDDLSTLDIGELDPILQDAIDETGYSTPTAITLFGLSFVIPFLGIGLVISLFPLVSGIICLVNAKKPEKLGTVFGWSIVGAVASFLAGSVVCLVLFIVSAVMANKDKKEFQQMAELAAYQPPAGQASVYQIPTQPAYRAPGEPAGQIPEPLTVSAAAQSEAGVHPTVVVEETETVVEAEPEAKE